MAAVHRGKPFPAAGRWAGAVVTGYADDDIPLP
jgi:hypothetical protein